MKTVKELKKFLDRSGIVDLTLANSESEHVFVGPPDQVTRVGSKLKMRWPMVHQSHSYRFSMAVLHVGQEILLAKEITPISLDSSSKHIELVFDYSS